MKMKKSQKIYLIHFHWIHLSWAQLQKKIFLYPKWNSLLISLILTFSIQSFSSKRRQLFRCKTEEYKSWIHAMNCAIIVSWNRHWFGYLIQKNLFFACISKNIKQTLLVSRCVMNSFTPLMPTIHSHRSLFAMPVSINAKQMNAKETRIFMKIQNDGLRFACFLSIISNQNMWFYCKRNRFCSNYSPLSLIEVKKIIIIIEIQLKIHFVLLFFANVGCECAWSEENGQQSFIISLEKFICEKFDRRNR